MYTYNQIFVGIPLTQTKFNRSQQLISELSECASEDTDLEGAVEYLKKGSEDAVKFSNWIEKNISVLQSLGMNFFHNYHGGDEYPEIFGVYVDQYFPIPDIGAQRVNFKNIGKIESMLETFKECISTLDREVLAKLESDQLIGIWINSHSS